MTSPNSAYGSWVLALRRWREDPRHDMSGLPTLLVDSLPPSAYGRLLDHITAAQQAVMKKWSETFLREWSGAGDDHARARALLGGRVLLARRMKLAGHPGLPELIRTELTKGVARDVEQLQKELEDVIVRAHRGSTLNQPQLERALEVLRSNSLTAILKPGFPLEAVLEGRLDVAADQSPPAVAEPAQAEPLPLAPSHRLRRTILIDSSTPSGPER